jgi:hypothetical protein
MLYHDRAIFTDLDQNLLGDPDSLADFIRIVRENRKCTSFGIATGRRLDSALAVDAPLRHPAPGRADHRAGHRDLLRAAAHRRLRLGAPHRPPLVPAPGARGPDRPARHQAPAPHRAEPLQGQLLQPGGDRQPPAPGGPERASEPLLRPVPGRGAGAGLEGAGAALCRRPMGHPAGTLPGRRRLRRRRGHDARQHPGRGRRQSPQRGVSKLTDTESIYFAEQAVCRRHHGGHRTLSVLRGLPDPGQSGAGASAR